MKFEFTQKLIDDLEKSSLAELQKMRIENEKLKTERDAAVADLKEISHCCNCICCYKREGNEIWCTSFGDWFEWYDTCEEWEWRGAQDGTDKIN